MIKEHSKELTNDEKIEEYLRSCKRRVEEIKSRNTDLVKPVATPKKKAETKVKKLYPICPKVALSVIYILSVGSLVGLLVYPDIKDAVYAFFEMLDPFKQFKGGNSIAPDNYVMFLNNLLWL